MTTPDRLRRQAAPRMRAAEESALAWVVDGEVVPQRRLSARLVVDARLVDRPPRARRRLRFRRWVVASVVVAIVFVVAGVSGVVLGIRGADAIGQVLTLVGSGGAVTFLLYALVSVRHMRPGHHCPGCQHH